MSKKNAYYIGFKYGYEKGYRIGTVTGAVKIMINMIHNGSPYVKEIFDISDDYYDEITAILKKYPKYSLEHKVQKVIFESTHLPYL